MKRTLRVVFVLNTFESDGPGHLVLRLSREVRKQGDARVVVHAISRDGELRPRFEESGIRTRFVHTRGAGGLNRLRRWAEALRRVRPDVVHTNLAWPDLAVRLVSRQLREVPIVSTCHGMNLQWDKAAHTRIPYTLLERATRSKCAGWTAVSEAVRQDMLVAGYRNDLIRVISSGVDTESFHPLNPSERDAIRTSLGLQADEFFLLAAGSLRRLKGYDLLFMAMNSVVRRYPRAKLFIFGDGADRSELLRLAGRLNLSASVSIRPAAPDIGRYMAAADLFVHPARHEAYGLVLAEAQAAGIPVVATRVGGVPEVVRDGKTGLLVQPEDSRALAGVLSQLLGNTDLRKRLGGAARENALLNHDIGRTAQDYVCFWRDVIEGRPVA